MTGYYPKSILGADALPDAINYIFYTMLADRSSPLRVILGYHGYAD